MARVELTIWKCEGCGEVYLKPIDSGIAVKCWVDCPGGKLREVRMIEADEPAPPSKEDAG